MFFTSLHGFTEFLTLLADFVELFTLLVGLVGLDTGGAMMLDVARSKFTEKLK